MMFDSDVLIWYTRRDENAVAWINSAPDRATSVVCVMEVLQGCRSKAEMSGVHATLHGLGFKTLPLSESIGEKALTLIQEHAQADVLHLTDALIAATAIEAGEALATSNVRYFRVIHSLEVKAFHPSARGSH